MNTCPTLSFVPSETKKIGTKKPWATAATCLSSRLGPPSQDSSRPPAESGDQQADTGLLGDRGQCEQADQRHSELECPAALAGARTKLRDPSAPAQGVSDRCEQRERCEHGERAEGRPADLGGLQHERQRDDRQHVGDRHLSDGGGELLLVKRGLLHQRQNDRRGRVRRQEREHERRPAEQGVNEETCEQRQRGAQQRGHDAGARRAGHRADRYVHSGGEHQHEEAARWRGTRTLAASGRGLSGPRSQAVRRRRAPRRSPAPSPSHQTTAAARRPRLPARSRASEKVIRSPPDRLDRHQHALLVRQRPYLEHRPQRRRLTAPRSRSTKRPRPRRQTTEQPT